MAVWWMMMVRLHLALCVLPWVANLAPPTPRHLLPSVTVHSTKSTGSNSAKRRKTTSRPKTGMTWTSPPKASENMIQTGQTCLNWGCCLLPYANPLRFFDIKTFPHQLSSVPQRFVGAVMNQTPGPASGESWPSFKAVCANTGGP